VSDDLTTLVQRVDSEDWASFAGAGVVARRRGDRRRHVHQALAAGGTALATVGVLLLSSGTVSVPDRVQEALGRGKSCTPAKVTDRDAQPVRPTRVDPDRFLQRGDFQKAVWETRIDNNPARSLPPEVSRLAGMPPVLTSAVRNLSPRDPSNIQLGQTVFRMADGGGPQAYDRIVASLSCTASGRPRQLVTQSAPAERTELFDRRTGQTVVYDPPIRWVTYKVRTENGSRTGEVDSRVTVVAAGDDLTLIRVLPDAGPGLEPPRIWLHRLGQVAANALVMNRTFNLDHALLGPAARQKVTPPAPFPTIPAGFLRAGDLGQRWRAAPNPSDVLPIPSVDLAKPGCKGADQLAPVRPGHMVTYRSQLPQGQEWVFIETLTRHHPGDAERLIRAEQGISCGTSVTVQIPAPAGAEAILRKSGHFQVVRVRVGDTLIKLENLPGGAGAYLPTPGGDRWIKDLVGKAVARAESAR
jgi:hypothetical protein